MLENDYDSDLLMALFSGQGELLACDTENSVNDTTVFNIPGLGKNGNVGRITIEDFNGEEMFAFDALYRTIKDAIKLKSDNRDLAIEWLFVPNMETPSGLTFALCCTALDARENLLRTRTQYEFYLKGIVTRLPFLSDSVPDAFELEAAGIGGDVAVDMISLLWQNPGLRADYFRNTFSEIEESLFRRITLDLECVGLIAMKNGCWYFTGRNPLIMRFGSRFNWTQVPVF